MKHRMWALLASSCLTAALAFAVPAAVPAVAAADPTAAEVVRIDKAGPRQQVMHVFSPSMGRTITLQVLLPFDNSEPRPTLYLLNGAGGGTGMATWYRQTDVVQFFANKNVNVVTPVDGSFSYYTDWQRDDPALGRHKWTTFLTSELPPVLDAALGASGANAIAGVSMSASSALNLAIAAPEVYRAVASYSGCASTSDQLGREYVELVLERGDADARNMWGEDNDPAWLANDALVNAERLRGKTLYISSSTGLPGPADTLDMVGGQAFTLANQIILGGAIEAATNQCTVRLADKLAALAIPATVEFRPTGTHSWKYWEDALHRSWPVLEEALTR
ncbi:alpha/beta hydrolase [Nocardia sp. NPDC057668]|uniref:alpha/beta hydrolase n=1 Tax=Nocardia sp. NPDC057668 TaxID=3346202 RepID=UPI00367336D6